MYRMILCILVTMNVITFGAGNKPGQQLRNRNNSAMTMSEKTQTILKNSGLSQKSHYAEIKELAYQVSDESSDCLLIGGGLGVCDAYAVWIVSKGCEVVPEACDLGIFSLLGAASCFCLLKACQHGRSAKELFALAQKKNQ